MSNKQNGFTLIELLIVLLIIGVLVSVSVYSLNLVRTTQKDKNIVKIKRLLHQTRHKSQMYNQQMRIRQNQDQETKSPSLIAEFFDVDKQQWSLDTSIEVLKFVELEFEIGADIIMLNPNGFITDTELCLNQTCVNSVKP